MATSPEPQQRYLPPAEVAQLLSISVDDVVSLLLMGQLSGFRVPETNAWRIKEDSVMAFLVEQTENVRRHALWEEAQMASFPEHWGSPNN